MEGPGTYGWGLSLWQSHNPDHGQRVVIAPVGVFFFFETKPRSIP
jgi:hypothetical protein